MTNSVPPVIEEQLEKAYKDYDPHALYSVRDNLVFINQFRRFLLKINKGAVYDLRELVGGDFLDILNWPSFLMHKFHDEICKNYKGIIADEYAISFFLAMDPLFFNGVESLEVENFRRR